MSWLQIILANAALQTKWHEKMCGQIKPSGLMVMISTTGMGLVMADRNLAPVKILNFQGKKYTSRVSRDCVFDLAKRKRANSHITHKNWDISTQKSRKMGKPRGD